MPMAKFLIIYLVMLFVLAIAWPLLKDIMPGGIPGDVVFFVGDVKIHLLFGTSVVFSAVIAFILWLFQKF